MKIKSIINFAIAALVVLGFGCQQQGTVNVNKLETLGDSTSYALGVLIGAQNKEQLNNAPGNEELNLEILAEVFRLYLTDTTSMDPMAANEIVRKFFTKANEAAGQEALEEGNAFLEENKTREGVVTTESGLQYEVLKQGDGPIPTAESTVKVHYHGTLIDGTVFDSSVEGGEPAQFGVTQVIPGWTEALQLMPVGSKYKLYIPQDLAYGANPRPGVIKPYMALIFEVELLEIVE